MKRCSNINELSPEDRIKLEEIEYRKQLIISHGFFLGEYVKVTSMEKDEVYRKLEDFEL